MGKSRQNENENTKHPKIVPRVKTLKVDLEQTFVM